MKELLIQIENIAFAVDANNYTPALWQGYRLLVRLHDAGAEQETVYRALFSYLDSLPESLSRNYIEDILDFVTGWCAPQYRIWKE